MQDSDAQQKLFVVLERGAQWPSRLDFGGLTDVHIVAQQEREANSDFARRVRTRVSRTCHSGGRIGASVLVVRPELDGSAFEARGVIARTLAAAVSWKPSAQLTLTGHALSRNTRAHLVALALVIEEELNDAVRIRVEAEPHGLASTNHPEPRSGIFARVDAEPMQGLRKLN